MANKEPDLEEVIRYIGLEADPGKIEEFWESEEERKSYLEKVAARSGKAYTLRRETSLVNVNLMSTADKVISIIGSVVLIISFLLPFYSFDLQGRSISGSGVSFFANLPFIGSYASWGGAVMVLVVITVGLILVACPVAGVLNLVGLLSKRRGEEYLAAVRSYSRVGFIPIFLYVILLALLVIGAPQPFGSLGSSAVGESLSVGSIFTMTGLGFWLNIAGLAIIFAQSRGI